MMNKVKKSGGHQNIVQLHESFADGDKPRDDTFAKSRPVYCIEMEFCSGGDLIDHAIQKGTLPESEVTLILKFSKQIN